MASTAISPVLWSTELWVCADANELEDPEVPPCEESLWPGQRWPCVSVHCWVYCCEMERHLIATGAQERYGSATCRRSWRMAWLCSM